MELHQCIVPADMLLDMKARDRWEALRELLDRVFPDRGPVHASVLSALYDAERARCSAIGRSVIIAHAVTDKMRGLRVVFGRSSRPIPWDAPDGSTVSILWLFAHSPAEHDDYLELLSQTVRLCRCDLHRTGLLRARSTAEVFEVLSKADCARPEGKDACDR